MLLSYISWHYGRGLRSVFAVAGNFLIFALHLFSVRELARSLFSPWKQIAYARRGLPLTNEALWALWTNIISRVLGGIVRSVLLFLGLLFVLWVGAAMTVFVLFWFVAPILPPLLFVSGLWLL